MVFSVQAFLDDDYVRGLYSGDRAELATIFAAYIKRFRALFFVPRYDLIWMEKEALPWLPAAIELFLMRGTPYVVDLDDAWFHRYDQNPWWIVRYLMAGKIDTVMRHAAAVVVGNEYLADRARRAEAKHVAIIPSVVDIDRYAPANVADKLNRDRNIPLVVGWIGTPITSHYLTLIAEAFRAIVAIRSVELHVVGASAPPEFSGLPVKSIGWTEATEIDAVRSFDVGIMPLDNTMWERGKCAYKLLQVMAVGRPVIASPVGTNCTVIRDGVNGFLADTPDQWIRALTALIDDPNLRKRMGLEAQQTIKDHYTVERVLNQLTSVLIGAQGLRDQPVVAVSKLDDQ